MLFYNVNYWVYMLPAIALVLFAQYYVRSSYKKWSQVGTRSRMTGAQAAERLIKTGRLYDVRVEAVSGKMTDHYDPRTKILRLSQGVYQTASVAAVAIAAHELGHALQDNEQYFPLKLRSAIIPAVNIGSTLGWVFIILGLFMHWSGLAWAGVIVFSAGALFALATLPVELNASARAKELLVQSGIIVGKEEQKGVNQVLNAAAFTYVAALLTSIMQLLYFTSLVGGMGGRRR
ncbi:MAG TPA: zinc metallopeptidase [Anaerolineales bacterium]|nr:zinc metallopeptidase [Anaerolineales bacterium]